MTIGLDIKFEGLEELEKFIEGGPRAIRRAMNNIVFEVGKVGARWMAVYPKQTEANKPGPYPKRWYQRHWGPRYTLKAGGVGGQNTSERLQKAWKVLWYTMQPDLMRADIYTESPVTGKEVSYVEHVLSEEKQSATHKEHGWKTDKYQADRLAKSRVTDKIIQKEFTKILK